MIHLPICLFFSKPEWSIKNLFFYYFFFGCICRENFLRNIPKLTKYFIKEKSHIFQLKNFRKKKLDEL